MIEFCAATSLADTVASSMAGFLSMSTAEQRHVETAVEQPAYRINSPYDHE
jgi:hypothetical protein